MKELLIIHFRPIALYPPVINLTRFLSEEKDVKVTLYTSSDITSTSFHERVEVIALQRSNSSILRLVSTLNFYLRVLMRLISTPNVPVLYYESLSSIPVWFYLTFFKHSKRRFAAHFHEYFSNLEYKRHSFWERTGRRLETIIFRKMDWISHTNIDRINFFQSEFPNLQPNVLNTFPNYPPKSWLSENELIKQYRPIKLVYVGSLSFEGTYLKEVVEWLISHNGELTCDFYSMNAKSDVVSYLQNKNQSIISFKGSVSYSELPGVLSKYHVGLVIYKSGSMNTNYCIPNKVFEYLACNLDVWFSDALISSRTYQQEDVYPKIIMVDFASLDNFDYLNAVNRSGLIFKQSPYTMESVYNNFYNRIIESKI